MLLWCEEHGAGASAAAPRMDERGGDGCREPRGGDPHDTVIYAIVDAQQEAGHADGGQRNQRSLGEVRDGLCTACFTGDFPASTTVRTDQFDFSVGQAEQMEGANPAW